MKRKIVLGLCFAALLVIGVVITVAAVSGAAYTTYNPWADAGVKDLLCKNSLINCNIYGAKEYVWLNGGPTANGLGPDGLYFFAVLAPGGQPDPNDGGAKNLSDDYDKYTNRIFTVENGEVAAYTGTHTLDSGNIKNPDRPFCNDKKNGCADGEAPLIRLAPYADTPNPGGVYIMAICSLQNGYPVVPRYCKYDAFKVRSTTTVDLMLSGMKFEDIYADGVKDPTDPGLKEWEIQVYGTGFDGQPINKSFFTNPDGYWEYSQEWTFVKGAPVADASLTVCEVLKTGWTQSYPATTCYSYPVIKPAAMIFLPDLDFGNWQPVSVKACKVQDMDGDPLTKDDQVAVPGWMVSLTKEGIVVDTQPTGADGCYTWTGLKPGVKYDVHEAEKPGWVSLGDKDIVFEKAESGKPYSHTFVNAALQGCTPGFWQGGSDGGQAGGQWLWNELPDPQWVASGGTPDNPYLWTKQFNEFFTFYGSLSGFDMMTLVGNGGGPDDYQKAARDLVAAYLNASWGMIYPYTPEQLKTMWAEAVASGDFMSLHLELDAANNAYGRTDGGPHCPISASGY